MMSTEIEGVIYLSTTEVADKLNVSRNIITKYVKEGKLKQYGRQGERTRYYKASDVEAFKAGKGKIYPIE